MAARRTSRRSAGRARIAVRFKRLPAQVSALRIGQLKFADDNGQFDLKLWSEAYEDDDPRVILDVKALTGTFDGLVNHYTEMLLAAARERDLPLAGEESKPRAPDLFDAVHADGGLTDAQVTTLKRLNWVRNQLQHSSPVIAAKDVYDAIRELNRDFVGLLQSYANWLKANGLDDLLAY